MRTSASIRLKSDRLTIRFEWLDFDGDDGFNTFRIDVVTEATTRRFDSAHVGSMAFANSAGSLGTQLKQPLAVGSGTRMFAITT